MPNSRDDKKEQTDLFDVKGPRSVPAIPEVELPPDERRRQRMKTTAITVITIALVAVTAFLARHVIIQERIANAVERATDEGRPSQIDKAIDLLDGTDLPVAARLHAAAALDGNTEALGEAKALIKTLGSAKDPDLVIARILVALSEGRFADARVLAAPGDYGAAAPEFFRARALALLAHAQPSVAIADVRKGLKLRPDTPKLEALQALALARENNTDAALSALNEASNSPIVATMRARLMRASDPQKAQSLAEAVLDGDDVSESDKSWASLVLGTLAFDRGALADAHSHLSRATKTNIRGDEALILASSQQLLALGDDAKARTVLSRLAPGPSHDVRERALTLAWLHDASGNRRTALRTIKTGGGSLEQAEAGGGLGALVAGHLASGHQSALGAFSKAAKDPQWRVTAQVAHATLLNRLRRHDQATAIAKKGLSQAKHHPQLVEQLAIAEQASGRSALAVIDEAIKAYPKEASLHALRGSALAALNKTKDAADAFAEATNLAPDNADFHAQHGEALRAENKRGEADKALSKALKLNPDHADGLVSMLRLRLDERKLADAEPLLAKLNKLKVPAKRFDPETVRFNVMKGMGGSALRHARAAIARDPKNIELRSGAIALALQAEQFKQAAGLFSGARRAGATPAYRYTGSALAHAYDKNFRAAKKSLDRVDASKDSLTAQEQTWQDVVLGRLALLQGQRSSALQRATQAKSRTPDDAHVHLLLADIEKARGKDNASHLRAAASSEVPLPVAMGRLATKLGPTTEGCAFANTYLKAARRGSVADRVKAITERCDKN